MVRDLVGEHRLHLVVREAAVEERVPEDDPLARAEADGVGVGRAREVGHVLDAERNRVDPLLRRVLASGRLQVGPLEPLRRGQVGVDEAEEDSEADEDGGRAEPPATREPSGERHHDDEREADEQKLGPELDPVREERLDVAAVGLVVASVPPHLREPERDLRDPDEREPDHPEQHSGADPAGRRLLREADPVLRVGDEHAEQDELRDDELDPEEALVAVGPLESPATGERPAASSRSPHAVDDARQTRLRGMHGRAARELEAADDALPERHVRRSPSVRRTRGVRCKQHRRVAGRPPRSARPRRRHPDPGQHEHDDGPRGAAATRQIASGTNTGSGSGSGGGRSAGLAWGYTSVRTNQYAFACAR